jgi:hypothetical protein
MSFVYLMSFQSTELIDSFCDLQRYGSIVALRFTSLPIFKQSDLTVALLKVPREQ